jgi:hypothetical protein
VSFQQYTVLRRIHAQNHDLISSLLRLFGEALRFFCFRVLQTANQTRELAADTLDELDRQGEKVGKIERDLTEVRCWPFSSFKILLHATLYPEAPEIIRRLDARRIIARPCVLPANRSSKMSRRPSRCWLLCDAAAAAGCAATRMQTGMQPESSESRRMSTFPMLLLAPQLVRSACCTYTVVSGSTLLGSASFAGAWRQGPWMMRCWGCLRRPTRPTQSR